MKYDLFIIGAGTAGLSAAIYGVRAGLKTICLEKEVHGGQIIKTPEVVNYPGIQMVTGVGFIDRIYKQVASLGAKIKYGKICDLDLGASPKKIFTDNCEYTADTVIIANGVHHRKLGCPGEENFKGKGVAYCAVCDGHFFENQAVCVVGGGNTALEDALYLSHICEKVHLIHRSDTFTANAIIIDQVKQAKNITVHLFSTVSEILGEETVNAVKVVNTNGDDEEFILPVSGVFIAIGLKPDNNMFSRWVDLDSKGYIVAGEDCKTKTNGVFVAGDTRTKNIRQLITAAADGAVAATAASQYLCSKK